MESEENVFMEAKQGKNRDPPPRPPPSLDWKTTTCTKSFFVVVQREGKASNRLKTDTFVKHNFLFWM